MGIPLFNVIGAIFTPKGKTPVTRLNGSVLQIGGMTLNASPINMTGFTGTSVVAVHNVAAQIKPTSNRTRTTNPGSDKGGAQTAPETPTKFTAADVKFNLPPHKWSLPLNPNLLSSNNNHTQYNSHSTRRARMWCYGATDLAVPDATTTSSTQSSYNTYQANKATGALAPLDTAWGFQFLWNPDSIGNALSRNVNFTPSTTDKTAKFYGLFTAMEAVSFKIIIDRVNDFASVKGMTTQLNQQGLKSETMRESFLQDAVNNYYAGTGFPSSPKNPENPVDQLKTLMKLGTMADIEYIYKMINGEGTNGSVWKNALGRKTADIGFLSPTVIAVQFGPNADSLSYVGYIDGLTITHNMFTEDMIPIHSEVTVNFVAYSRTALSQG